MFFRCTPTSCVLAATWMCVCVTPSPPHLHPPLPPPTFSLWGRVVCMEQCESAAALLESVREQEVQFEQLTRALEEERRRVGLPATSPSALGRPLPHMQVTLPNTPHQSPHNPSPHPDALKGIYCMPPFCWIHPSSIPPSCLPAMAPPAFSPPGTQSPCVPASMFCFMVIFFFLHHSCLCQFIRRD